jgi:hypothetical protein
MGEEWSTRGEMRNVYKSFVGKPEGKRPLGRSKRRWEINNRKVLTETGSEGMDRMHLAQDRDLWRAVVYTVMNLRVP